MDADRARYQRVSTSNPLQHGGSSPQRHVRELELGNGVVDTPLEDLSLEEVHEVHSSRANRKRSNSLKTFLRNIHAQYVCILALVGFIAAISLFNFYELLADDDDDSETAAAISGFRANSISFGSCSSYDLRDMSIWDDAIIPSQPEAWIWTGDLVYVDDNEINCSIFESTAEWQRSCNCTADWLQRPPYSCHAADLDHISERWLKGLRNAPYTRFLDYMCPKALALGYFPPPGHDPEVCERAVLGIYDDHDFGANDGNAREPSKRVFKNLYLDAIGEDASSPRRNANRGAWAQYALHTLRGAEVDVFVLDERYEREPLPCDTRAEYCRMVLADNSSTSSAVQRAWCRDFLRGGPLGEGSCCRKDEDIFFGWCRTANASSSPWFRYACDVSFASFGMKALHLLGGELVEPTDKDAVDGFQDSPFCEVLGRTQRRWLQEAVSRSTAAVQVFVSSSVLLYDPTPSTCGTSSSTPSGAPCRCGGDNLDCYRTAQAQLLHTIATSSQGCAVVLTGDYHFR